VKEMANIAAGIIIGTLPTIGFAVAENSIKLLRF